jgi:hypothetical protein
MSMRDVFAAARLDEDRPCDYDDCPNGDDPAEFVVELEPDGDNRKAFVCCSDCSQRQRIFVKENDLLASEVSETVRDEFELIEEVRADGGSLGVDGALDAALAKADDSALRTKILEAKQFHVAARDERGER